MNEALAISAANLDIIEKNLGSVATELSGVINNVNNVNFKVDSVEQKVLGLNDEIRNLITEIRENTIVNNARQNIMYNNDLIEKKYGYYDNVRRTCESLLDSLLNSKINKSSIITLNQNILLNNPNYWLSNAVSAITYWLLDDKVNTEKEVNNSLKKDEIKTSLFFSLVNLKLNRNNASINWLKYYLGRINPANIGSEFVTVLDLVSNNYYGTEGKKIILDKINNWINILNQDKKIYNEEINTWINFIHDNEINDLKMYYLNKMSPDYNIIDNNIKIVSSYNNVYSYLNNITNKSEEKSIDEILNNLIFEYEVEEQTFQKDNLKNRLIIECNGDTKKAEELFEKEQKIYSEKVNLISLLNNIVLYNDEYKISSETRKFALSLIKNYIMSSYDIVNSYINENDLNIIIEDLNLKTKDGLNKDEINNILNNYINSKFNENNNYLIPLLIILNIVGIVGIFFTLKSVLFMILIVILALADFYILFKIFDNYSIKEKNKKIKREYFDSIIEKVLAETIDYSNYIKNEKKNYDNIKMFLDNININSYVKTNNERNIEIGE